MRLTEAGYTPAVAMKYGPLKTPRLEAISLGGDLRVINSPINVEACWSECEYPLAIAYRTETTLPLGMNILLYSCTH